MPEIFSSIGEGPAEARVEGLKKIDRFFHLAGIENIGEIEDPQVRVDLIKNISLDQFLGVLHLTDELLIGKENPEADRKEFIEEKDNCVKKKVVLRDDYETEEVAPFSNFNGCVEELSTFFKEMQENISTETIDKYAYQLLIALQTAHIFPDGNGRMARVASLFLSKGIFSIDSLTSSGCVGLFDFMNQRGEAIYNIATYSLFMKHAGDDKKSVFDHICLERELCELDLQDIHNSIKNGKQNELMTQKWLAAFISGLTEEGQQELWGDDWTNEEMQKFKQALNQIQREVFRESIKIAGSEGASDAFKAKIDEAIQKIKG